MLLQGDLVSYLLEHGDLDAEQIVDGDVTIEDASRRNRNFRVLSKRGRSYFVKQAASLGSEETIAREAAVLGFLSSLPAERNITHHVPAVTRFDPKRSVLIFPASRRAATLDEVFARTGRISREAGTSLGAILGSLHRATRSGRTRARCRRAWPGDPPWALGIHRPDVPTWWIASEANLHVLRIIQGFPEFRTGLDNLRGAWRGECLIHGDLKSANVVVRPGLRGLTIVDWELAGFGDPAWDVGSVWGDALGLWILTIPMSADTSIEQFLKLAPFPLKQQQPGLRAFWRRYVEERSIGAGESRALLARSVGMGAARLLQTAFEATAQAARPAVNVAYMIQLGWNMMKRPEAAALNLLGLDS